MAIEVFNRYEKKYLLNMETYKRLIEEITPFMAPDKYNCDGKAYRISNIYYDTFNDSLIRSSIEKPLYKEKLRLRAYGVPNDFSPVFVEIKKKYNGIVNKRRIGLTLKEAVDYLNNDIGKNELAMRENINTQIFNEIDYFKNYYKLIPKLYLSYDRYAYFEKKDKDFRITFDENITTRRSDLDLSLGSYGEKLLPDGTVLMETKINGAVPLWFTEIISRLNIYPTSFSKYGTEYKRYYLNNNVNQREKGEQIICLNQYLLKQQRAQSVLANQ